MSLDNLIFMETDASVADIQRLLEQRTSFVFAEEVNQFKIMVAEASVLAIRSANPNEVWIREFAIRPNLRMTNTYANHTSSALWKLETMRIVMALLHAYPGDLMFIYFDLALVMRKDGRIVLERDIDVWTAGGGPEMLALMDLPYEWGHNPMP